MNLKKHLIVTVATAIALVSLYSASVYAPSHPEFATTIRVSLFEWGISLEQSEAVEGTVILEIVNEGTMNHALKIGGLSTGTAETDSFAPGSSRTLNVELSPGQYDLWCPIPGHRSQGMETTMRVTAAPPSPPPPGSSGSPSDFDDDGNCSLSDAEFFVAIDFWIGESISDQLFFNVVDAWIAEANLCAVPVAGNSSAISASMSRTGDEVIFTSAGLDAEGISVDIYDLSGKPIAHLNNRGHQLKWNLNNEQGVPVPNGVYLYRSTIRDASGALIAMGAQAVQKIVIMR